jgi:hypothetical protein
MRTWHFLHSQASFWLQQRWGAGKGMRKKCEVEPAGLKADYWHDRLQCINLRPLEPPFCVPCQ